MKLLNLGCGHRFHTDWTNIDFVSSYENVLSHNLLNGIPFLNESFDVVYHSHVLEHFKKEDGKKFIQECNRVLKSGGIIRIAVPDLERIVRGYLEQLEKASQGDDKSKMNYYWMLLEMYDQVVRNSSGGDMAKYFYSEKMENEDFVYDRLGQEGKIIRENYLRNINSSTSSTASIKGFGRIKIRLINLLINIFKPSYYKTKIVDVFFRKEKEWLEIGKFRSSGEIHQWMYDRYSLSELLIECGFTDVQVKTAFTSDIPEWNTYELDSKDGVVHKPDSLFIEAKKR